jgi:hypothetical protein
MYSPRCITDYRQPGISVSLVPITVADFPTAVYSVMCIFGACTGLTSALIYYMFNDLCIVVGKIMYHMITHHMYDRLYKVFM